MIPEIAIIIQARSGSTRLPHKMLLPFADKKSILEIVIDRLKADILLPIIVATSNNSDDDIIANVVGNMEVDCYRGSEENVLNRYIDAADYFGYNKIIRVCADNPFLNSEALRELVSIASHSNSDYISFKVNNTPVIKSHFGFWAEYITLNSLKRVKSNTKEVLYLEHVTNYIYEHPELFKIEWVATPECVNGRNDIRLTIDTRIDFEIAQLIFQKIYTKMSAPLIKDIVRTLDQNPSILKLMNNEIIKNTK